MLPNKVEQPTELEVIKGQEDQTEKVTDEEDELEGINEFDDILERIGAKGRFQQLLFYGFVCPIIGISPLTCLSTIYLQFIPDHWCFQEGIQRLNETELDLWKVKNLPLTTGPEGQSRFSQCQMYDETGSIIDCPNGWQYDTSDFLSTIPSEFNWVCNLDHYSTNVFTIGSVGSVAGTIIFGLLADKVGRKPIFFLSALIYLVFRVISLFLPQYFVLYNMAMFLSSAGYPFSYLIPGMLIAEMTDDEYRSFTASFAWAVWVFGMAALPYVAYYAATWFLIGLVTYLPLFLTFLYIPFLPESPRWLTSVGRITEAASILQHVAKVNGTQDKMSSTQIESALQRVLAIQQQKECKNIGVWTLFSRRNLAKNTILLCISWTVNNMIYDSITLNTPNMSGDQFFNFFILSIIEVPSSIVGGYLLGALGRRWTQVIFFFMSAITFGVATAAVTLPNSSTMVIISAVAAKFAITITFLILYLQANELFPTSLRSSGNSFCGTVGSIMGIFGPSIVYLGRFYAGAPYLAMALMSLTGMIVTAFLPETLHQHLPETVEDADAFGKEHIFWSLKPKRRKSEINVGDINKILAARKMSVTVTAADAGAAGPDF